MELNLFNEIFSSILEIKFLIIFDKLSNNQYNVEKNKFIFFNTNLVSFFILFIALNLYQLLFNFLINDNGVLLMK